jgi:hypothetical protein
MLKSSGASVDELVKHYIYMTEYCWKVLMPHENQKTITVFDVDNLGMRDLKGDVMAFIKRTTKIIQLHYPERSQVILVINAPAWFSFVFKLIKPMLTPQTIAKVKIFSKAETLIGMQEFIEIAQIPAMYGGMLQEQVGSGNEEETWRSAEDKQVTKHVHLVNSKFEVGE